MSRVSIRHVSLALLCLALAVGATATVGASSDAGDAEGLASTADLTDGNDARIASTTADGAAARAATAECVPGDVDDSGEVNSLDATLTKRHVAGHELDEFYPDCADMDGDDDVSSLDATLVLQKIAEGGFDTAAVEHYVHEAINEERQAHGESELNHDGDLREIARGHSEDMAERGYFSHTDPEGNDFSDRYEEAGYECQVESGDGYYYTGAENIAQTWYDESTSEQEVAQEIVDMWMNSDGHRENILAPYWENEGIGIAVTDEGKVLATQNFC